MTTNFVWRLLAVCAAACVVALFGSSPASAQRFQYVYGGPNCSEAGRAGVTQLAGGGYITVGETYSTFPTCGTSHVYVVCTNVDGSLRWSNIYNIGSSDSALDVVECSNGDFAICGVVTNAFNANPGRDAFALRISSTGVVLAVRTFGLASTDEIFWNLIEAKTGDNVTSHPGDLIFAGSTTYNAGINVAGTAQRDGFILRTDAALNVIWGNHYGGTASRDDYFYGVYESRVGVPALGVGDIVATGGTNTWGAGGYDIWVARVSGNNGTFNGAPQNAATYGGPRDDEGRAIIELRFAKHPGDLVITGISFSRPGNINSEVAMLQTRPDPCTFVADQYAGDNDPHPDGGMDLKEDAFPSDCDSGDVIVTGFTDWGGPLLNPPNVFLEKFQCGRLVPSVAPMAYGGSGIDWGWSVDNATRTNNCDSESQGYIVAGFTQSHPLIPAVDPQQLYLIKTDLNLSSNCNEVLFVFNAIRANFLSMCPRPAIQLLDSNRVPGITTVPATWGQRLCYAYPIAQQGGNGGADGISGVRPPVLIPFIEGNVATYPNPVTVGTPLNLRFNLADNAVADVTVSDIAGREVYHESLRLNAGANLEMVPTEGWSAGAYIVHVTMGATSSTTRVVVEK